MAILYDATLTPTKPEIAESWLDRQSWGGSGEIETIGSYRFDDPEGQVGVETLLVRRADRVLQVPMTYRAAPLAGAQEYLIATMQHSILGKRWIYEAAADPVAVDCFTRALRGEQQQAALEVYEGDERVAVREQSVRLRRESGNASSGGELRLAGVLGAGLDGGERLVATFADGDAVVAVR